MVEHSITKALATYIGTLSTGWTVTYDHSSSAKAMPRIVVSSDSAAFSLRSRIMEASIRAEWLPDDTTDDAAHAALDKVRKALDAKYGAGTALNVILNPLGIAVIWLCQTGADQGAVGERGRYAAINLRIQYYTGTAPTT